ncbi:MAG TPA: DotU family type IV/VI secretion system protein, partial [Nitrospirales bacterium]|nr:DotU family type IV/VI secretion system protein [Nitrospirales bacterium]
MTAAVTRPDLFTTARPFFHEVIRLKASIHVAMPDGSIEPGIESAPVAARVRAMQQSLLTLLRTDLRPEPEREELQALLVAFADEAFTSVLWPGRNLWRLEPLEHALFHGRSVTSRIFERLDALLQRNQPADAPLATVYL